MPEQSATGDVRLREFIPSVDKSFHDYELFIGQGEVTYVSLVESSANLSVAEARRLVRGADVAAQRDLLNAFLERITKADDVAEAWLVQEANPVALAVIVRNLSLDRDLELRAAFADLAMDHDAELRVYDADEDRAALGRRGERLLG